MKKLILLALVASGGWWYFVGGRTLTEDHVRAFYQDLEHATLAREPKVLCEMLADDFETTGTTSIGGRRVPSTANKEQTCKSYAGLYDSFDKIGQRLGGIVQLDSSYEIHGIEISSDKKKARVDISNALDVGGSIMNIRSRSWDTLIRRNGKVLLLRSEGDGSIDSGA